MSKEKLQGELDDAGPALRSQDLAKIAAGQIRFRPTETRRIGEIVEFSSKIHAQMFIEAGKFSDGEVESLLHRGSHDVPSDVPELRARALNCGGIDKRSDAFGRAPRCRQICVRHARRDVGPGTGGCNRIPENLRQRS